MDKLRQVKERPKGFNNFNQRWGLFDGDGNDFKTTACFSLGNYNYIEIQYKNFSKLN